MLVVLALVVASALRWRQTVAARERRALPRPVVPPGGDPLSTFGLSAVRPAAPRPREATPADDADRPDLASREPTRPAAPPPPSDWTDDAPSWTFDPESDVPSDPLPIEVDDEAHPDDRLAPPPAAEAPAAEAPAAEAPADAERPARHAAPLTSSRPAPAAVRPDSRLWDPPGPAEHLLASLAACTGGTVAVLRHDGDRYHVEALAGLDAHPWPAPLDTPDDDLHPLDRAPLDRVLSVLDGDGLDALTYLAPGLAEAALVRALDESDAPRVLVAITLAVGADHVDLATATLVGDYVDLLATLRADAPAVASVGEPMADEDSGGDEWATAEDDSATDDPDVDILEAVTAPGAARREAEPLPRSVILMGEIAAAREARRDLAFALVTVGHAEALLDGDEAMAEAAETELETRLRAAPRVRRVEPFGPLLFGVFLDAAPDQVSPWARALSEKGPTLHVGAVAPAAGAPDAVRAAATTALEDAYSQNVVCVVVD